MIQHEENLVMSGINKVIVLAVETEKHFKFSRKVPLPGKGFRSAVWFWDFSLFVTQDGNSCTITCNKVLLFELWRL